MFTQVLTADISDERSTSKSLYGHSISGRICDKHQCINYLDKITSEGNGMVYRNQSSNLTHFVICVLNLLLSRMANP